MQYIVYCYPELFCIRNKMQDMDQLSSMYFKYQTANSEKDYNYVGISAMRTFWDQTIAAQ